MYLSAAQFFEARLRPLTALAIQAQQCFSHLWIEWEAENGSAKWKTPLFIVRDLLNWLFVNLLTFNPPDHFDALIVDLFEFLFLYGGQIKAQEIFIDKL